MGKHRTHSELCAEREAKMRAGKPSRATVYDETQQAQRSIDARQAVRIRKRWQRERERAVELTGEALQQTQRVHPRLEHFTREWCELVSIEVELKGPGPMMLSLSDRLQR